MSERDARWYRVLGKAQNAVGRKSARSFRLAQRRQGSQAE